MNDFFNMMFVTAAQVEGFAHARIISFITERNKKNILAMGKNQYKTHPFQKRFGKNNDCIYLHAETDAIKNALKTMKVDNLEDCDLYVMRLKQASKTGPTITGLSKPCIGCMRAIVTFGIHKVYYTEDNASDFVCL